MIIGGISTQCFTESETMNGVQTRILSEGISYFAGYNPVSGMRYPRNCLYCSTPRLLKQSEANKRRSEYVHGQKTCGLEIQQLLSTVLDKKRSTFNIFAGLRVIFSLSTVHIFDSVILHPLKECEGLSLVIIAFTFRSSVHVYFPSLLQSSLKSPPGPKVLPALSTKHVP